LAGSSNALSAPVDIRSGQTTALNVPAYSSPSATISGKLFVDGDGSGSADGSNAGLSGVSVSLVNGTQTVATTTTDANGNYSFTVSPGTYTIEVSQPTGYSLEGTTTNTWTALVNAPSQNSAVNEGVYQPASVSGSVSVGSSGLAGVSVTFTDMNGNVVGTTTAGASGSYQVTGLAPGMYVAQFTAPSGYVLNGSSNTTSTLVTVGSGQSLAAVNATAYSSTVPTSIAGQIFLDNDGSGTADGANPGLAGVTVTLEYASGNSVTNASGNPVGSVTTDSSGDYSFSDLLPGTYLVEFSSPSGDYLEATGGSSSVLSIATPGPNQVLNIGANQFATVSGTVFQDNAGTASPGGGNTGLTGITVTILDLMGNVVTSTTTGSNGSYSVGLPTGTYTIRIGLPSGAVLEGSSGNTLAPISVSSGQAYSNINAGVVSTGSSAAVGGFAFADTDSSGLRNLNDPALSGIEVELLNSSGVVVATTTTDADGYYQFSNVSAGTYSIMFIIPSSDTGASFTTEGASTDPTVSSSANTSGLTDSFTLAAGQDWLAENVGLAGIAS
jgi:protocatechuate 3,4-dioxygenase beta subunit